MDPLSLMTSAASLIGMGIQGFGMSQARTAANNISSAEQSELQDETQENQLRQEAMNLSAQRQQVQNVRNTQRARAMGVAAAVGSGAQYGSGTKGAQGVAEAQGAFTGLGISQNQQVGNKIFGVDYNIDSLKSQIGQDQTSLQNAQGLMSLGGSIAGSSQQIGRLGSSGFGFFSNLFGNQGSTPQGVSPSGFNPMGSGGLY